MKTIQIRCEGSRSIDIDELIEFQGGLKDLEKSNYEKLKKEIEETGFAFPIYVWKQDGKERVLGGHQRLRTLKTMRATGYEIPPIPVIDIEAKDEKEAKRRILQDASQYGTVNEDGFLEFLTENQFDLEFAKDSFRLPDINWDSFFDSNTAKDSDSSESVSIQNEFLIVVQCKDEQEQALLYAEFKERNLECKVM